MKIIELNDGTPEAPVMTKTFTLYPGGSTPGVTDPRIILEPGVGVEEVNTDARHDVSVGPDGRTTLTILGSFPAGPQEPGGVFLPKYGDGDPIVTFRLVGDLSRTYDGRVTGTAPTGSNLRIGSLWFGNHTIKAR